jgi:hypothetical protein
MATQGLFTTVTTAGGLLPADLLARLARSPDDVPGTSPADYHLSGGQRLRDAVNRSWTELQGAWAAFAAEWAKLPAGERATTVTRERWLLPLFAELGFGRLARSPAISAGGREFPVSHAWGAVPIHLLGADVDLDHKTKGVAGAAGAAPHSMVQGLLNRSDDHLWAMLSNGRQLRLLRDNSSFARAAYLEFDLQAMFDGQVFTDFALLWLVCHQSRLEAARPEDCWLERWVALARDQGVRALDSLRTGFEEAITALGAGFLAHPVNSELRDRLSSGQLIADEYFHELLRLVYRLVFLLVVEDRDLVHPLDTPDEARYRYGQYYSVGRIRDHARRHRGGRYGDFWEALKPVFAGLGGVGIPAIGVPALGSFLWSEEACPDLDQACLTNNVLLAAVRHLAYVQRDKTLHRVDFVNLGPEELGSVYESLLELHPRLEAAAGKFTLVAVTGSERKSTGSYYTPTTLISALLDVSLDRLLDEAEPSGRKGVLALKVLDPACGSGHFLTAAAHRIATRLASIDTGELIPTPVAVRHALRAVVGHCIYGIDVNPMAVELCKVNLWLETIEPGKPLSFLDHHVVCGNALLGATPRLLADGVPDAAFTAIKGDHKSTVTARRRANASQRANRFQGTLDLIWTPSDLVAPIAKEIAAIEAVPGDTHAEVEEQGRRFEQLLASTEVERARLAADAWCAAFVAIKDRDHIAITDEDVRAAAAGPNRLPAPVLDEIHELATEYCFLHWHLAFPQVFTVDLKSGEDCGWRGGFDLVLGNPPWDTLSPDVKEFFSRTNPGIVSLPPAEQQTAINDALADKYVAEEYEKYRRKLFAEVHFLKRSGRYSLFSPGNLGKGDFNISRIFIEVALRSTRRDGYVAQVTPAGLYGGANETAIRKYLFEHCSLDTIFGFGNENRTWFDIGLRFFSAYSARIGDCTTKFNARFGIARESDLSLQPIPMSKEMVAQQSPVTWAIPDIRDDAARGLMAKVDTRFPSLGQQVAGYPYRHHQREIRMGENQELFTTDPAGLPLYEGRMIDHFDYRAKQYVSGHGRSTKWIAARFGSAEKIIRPQWRILRSSLPNKLGDLPFRYRVGFMDVAGPRDIRTLVAALLPPMVVAGHTVPTISFPPGADWAYLTLLAVANSFVMDATLRRRMSSTHVTITLIDGLPLPRLPIEDPVVDRLSRLALRLTCTGPEMAGYWNSMAERGWCTRVGEGTTPPGYLDQNVRTAARAEIDAIVAHELFELSSEELGSVLDAFPVLRRREEKQSGEFVTKRLVLEQYELLDNAGNLDSYPSVLDT